MPEAIDRPTQNLETLPSRMRSLPRSKTGWVVPWFISPLPDGSYDHRFADARKVIVAVKRDLCWLCGEKLGRYRVFVIGPLCAITGFSAEPPGHLECARWAVENCPFLARPKARRRENNIPEEAVMADGSVRRNPGVTMLWVCHAYEIGPDSKGIPMFHIGEPVAVHFFAEGRKATREEIDESVRTGLPLIEEEARKSVDPIAAFQELGRRQRALEALLPAA